MKRYLFYIIIFLLLPVWASAAPAYGTKMPSHNQFYFGGQTYTVFNRHLRDQYGELRSLQHFMLISYGITDWFSLDLKGGGGYIKQHPIGSDELDYPTFVGGGYGFRIRIYNSDKIKSVLGFQHISIHPYQIEVNDVKHKSVLDDWQISCLVSYAFDWFTPYLGGRVSRMDYIHWVDGVRKRKNSDRTENLGLIFGVDIPINSNVWFNLEGSVFDAEAVAASVNFHF